MTDDSGQGTWSVFASGDFDNASDPDIYRCYGPGMQFGWCMVTSRDFGGGSGKFYPMEQTRAFWSADGIKWDMGAAVLEGQLPLRLNNGSGNRAQVQDLPMHLWAPTVRYVNAGTTASPDYQHRIYVPDVVRQHTSINNGYTWFAPPGTTPGVVGGPNKWDPYSSRIFMKATRNLFSSSDANLAVPNSTSGDLIQVFTPFAGNNDNGSLDPKKYMSDPDVFSDTTDLRDTSKDYLLWANGDYNNCGGLSIGKLNAAGTQVTGPARVGDASNPDSYRIRIKGIPAEWGIDSGNGCRANTDADPYANPLYYEGPSLYLASELGMWNAEGSGVGKYVLVFPVKPKVAPGSCSGSDRQAIVWASASNVAGPYTYGDIIHCGSSQSWTNHGSMTTIPTTAGRQQLVYIGHDQKPNAAGYNRQLRAECVYFRQDARMVPSPRTLEGAATGTGANAHRNWCLTYGEPVMLANKAISRPTPFSAVYTDGWGNWLEARDRGTPTSGWPKQGVTADSKVIFAMQEVFNGGGQFGLSSLATNRWWTVHRGTNGDQISAIATTVLSQWEKFKRFETSNGTGTVLVDERGWPVCKDLGAGIHAEEHPDSWQSSQGINSLPTRCKWEWTWLQ